MPDNFAHQYNANRALETAGYTPRSYAAFIWGANGPDPLFCYKIYEHHIRHDLYGLAVRMHNEKTGQFLHNLFRFAQTNAQKDYCLGFLCHYSLDSILHPYINYITTAYGSPFNVENGHQLFESSLDTRISYATTGQAAADYQSYCPEIKKSERVQIIALFKKAVEATYTDVSYDFADYMQAFEDFKKVKRWLYSPSENKSFIARGAELLLGRDKGFVSCRLQPCKNEIKEIAVWRHSETGLFCTATIEELLGKACQTSADYIDLGLTYFHGIINVRELMEDVGNKSYITGVTIDV